MPIYTRTIDPRLAETWEGAVIARATAFLTSRGYVVGPEGIQAWRDGTLRADLNRDPIADWATFNPATPTAAELKVAGQAEIEALGFTVAQVRTVHGQLKTGTASTANTQKALAGVMRYLWRDLVGDP